MRVVEPSFVIKGHVDGKQMLKNIEEAGRLCYKSENLIKEDSAEKFIANIIARGHESVIEHEKITALITCDRGVTHEIVRHRIASYSQESTRYCNYSKNKFGNELTFIKPYFWAEDSDKYKIWLESMAAVEKAYMQLLELGATPEEARSILPNSLKTDIFVTMNLREWRHFFKLRVHEASHPQMREIARPMLDHFKQLLPVVFDDINY